VVGIDFECTDVSLAADDTAISRAALGASRVPFGLNMNGF